MHNEFHRSDRIGWLRAAVLGANDGLISTSSLVVGVAAAEPGRVAILLAAIAGLAAGAPLTRGALRMVFWGAVAMGCTFAVGRIFGAVV